MSSPTRTTSTNKRKVDALGDSGDSGRPAAIARLKDATSVSDPSFPTIPHIPPPVWGRVLDFMPYEEVRSALLVGKIIANEAVKYVRVLNFMKGCQLDGPPVRRFASVEEVNCLCLISGQWRSTVLCRDTTIRLVPLLMTFPKIRHVYVGGLLKEVRNGQERLVRHDYHPGVCSSPANHRDLAKVLCYSFLGAFKARLLPQALHSKGYILQLFESSHVCQGDGTRSGDTLCETCADICSCFPLQNFMQHPYFCRCASEFVVLENVAKREGSREAFRKASSDLSSYFLDEYFHAHLLENAESKEEEALRHRLTDLGVRTGEPCVCYLNTSNLIDLDRLIAVGFDPKMIPKNDLYEMMIIGEDSREHDVFAKSTFDALVARGFAFEEADLIVLDERTEPALKELSARIRGDS